MPSLYKLKHQAFAMARANGHCFSQYHRVGRMWVAECVWCGRMVLVTTDPVPGVPHIIGEVVDLKCPAKHKKPCVKFAAIKDGRGLPQRRLYKHYAASKDGLHCIDCGTLLDDRGKCAWCYGRGANE